MTGHSAENDARFCPACGVVLGLHDGPETCGLADRRVQVAPGAPEVWRRPIPSGGGVA